MESKNGRSLAFSWAVLSGLVDLVVGLSRGESNSRRLEEDGERDGERGLGLGLGEMPLFDWIQ